MILLIRLLLSIGVPDEHVAPKTYAILIDAPNSVNALNWASQVIISFLTGLLSSSFRDCSSPDSAMKLAHINLCVQCKSKSCKVLDKNYAVPSGEDELAKWLLEIRKESLPKVRSLLNDVLLSLIDGKRP